MRIALLSDTHLTPAESAFDANLLAARRFVTDHGIQTTIHLGDLSADGQRVAHELDHAAAQLADWPGALHLLFGNHDIGDNPGTHGHRAVTGGTLDAARARFGLGRFRLSIPTWLLIGIDAQLLGRNDELEAEQASWLDAALSDSPGPVGLFLHKPLFREGPADTSTHHRYVPVEARNALLTQFAHRDLRFVVSGHTHQSRRVHIGGVEHVWVPSTAFVLPDWMQERIGAKEVGMATLTLEADRHAFERHCPPGMTQLRLTDHAHVYPEHENELRRIADDRDS